MSGNNPYNSAVFFNFITRVLLLTPLLLLCACATSNAQWLSTTAERYNLHQQVVPAERFSHTVFRNFQQHQGDSLHVYIEGDGVPWRMRYFPSKDPTARSSLMLELMAKDSNPSIYLGRPCYALLEPAPQCHAKHWTSGRYSVIVVQSMAAVLEQEVARTGASSVSLIGHSGGGTLALLLAARVGSVDRVITLAGNIDIQAWVAHHGYAPLHTSLNPAHAPLLPEHIEQVHLLGGKDSNIPPALSSGWIKRQPNSYGITYENFNHNCCWSSIWSDVLNTLRSGPPYRFLGRVFKYPQYSQNPVATPG